tara:strand:- start:533 stop:1594 length:1062 start_codon:yes stop_codon:yes gene_type:complete
MPYTTLDDPSAYFQTATYSGSSSDLTVTNDGNSDLKPDWLWIKQRSSTENHMLVDSTRGVTKYLISDSTTAEQTVTSRVATLDTDGFTLNGASNPVNAAGATYVGWQWKANGGTTTAFSESGANPGGTRQTNTTAGFSIIGYTGTGSNGTIAHGLPSTPEFIIFKRRNNANFWCVWHQAIGDDYKLALQSSDALDADGAFMASTLPTSTNITVGGASVNTNADTGTYICYAFSPIKGFSQFGSYIGNQDSNGMMCYCSFQPAWVMVKKISGTGPWNIFDHKRNGFNVDYLPTIQANAVTAEFSNVLQSIDILSNGFKIRTNQADINQSGQTYIYMAFASNPFVTSGGVPSCAF